MSNLDLDPSMGDHALFSVKNNQNRASFFPGKERGDRALILPYLDSPIAKVFSWKILIFYFGHFRRKWAGQSWTKSANFGYVPFPKKLAFFEDSWKTAFLSLALPLVKISAKSDNIWESKGPKNPKRGPCHGCWISTKNVEIFILTTTNAILMKLTMITYLHKIFNFPKSWGVTHQAKEGINEKPHRISQKVIFCLNFKEVLKLH